MNEIVTIPEIQTLGDFCISVGGKSVAAVWPNETLKVLFCSLLSPLDLYINWDRFCRSLWGTPASRSNMRRLDEIFIQPVNSYLVKEMGFNPIITERDGMRIDKSRIHLDAVEFYSAVIEGLRLLSLENNDAALEKFNRANLLYAGSFLPGMSGKIIENTRHALDSFHQISYMSADRSRNWVCVTMHR
jgi:hypothetical protein